MQFGPEKFHRRASTATEEGERLLAFVAAGTEAHDVQFSTSAEPTRAPL